MAFLLFKRPQSETVHVCWRFFRYLVNLTVPTCNLLMEQLEGAFRATLCKRQDCLMLWRKAN